MGPKKRFSIIKKMGIRHVMEAIHMQASTVKIQVQDSEADGNLYIKSHVRFKNHYTEKLPRVIAWIQRKNFTVLERMSSDTIKVSATGFDVAIRHMDPSMMDGAVINWFAYTPPKSNPALAAVIETILSSPSRNLTSEIDAAVSAYLKDGGSVNDMDTNGQTLLHAAATAGNSRLVKHLLSKGARINAADEHSWTALLCAISPGFLDTALQLIAAGADVSVVTESENNALHYLARLAPAGNPDYMPLLSALIRGGCDPNTPNLDGDTPLSTMCQRAQRVDVIEALIRGCSENAATAARTPRGTKPSQPSSSSSSSASNDESEEVICVNPNIVNNVGMSPLHWAIDNDMTSVITLLLESGADPKLPSILGTPLEYAEKHHKAFAINAMRSMLNAQTEEAAASRSNNNAAGAGGDAASGECGALLVEVVEARDVENAKDVYCVIKHNDQEHHTEIVSQTPNPVWKSQFKISCGSGGSERPTVLVQVLNFQMAKSSELLGSVSLNVRGLRPGGPPVDKWYRMESFSKTQNGSVHIRVQPLASITAMTSSMTSLSITSATMPIAIGGRISECTFPVEPGFSTLPFPREEWTTAAATVPPGACAIDPGCTESGYHVETSAAAVTHSIPPGEARDFDELATGRPFATLFESSQYTSVYGFDEGQPVVFSVACEPGANGLRRVIMRTKKESLCIALPAGVKGDIPALQQAIPALENVKLVSCKSTSPQAVRLLHNYEEHSRNAAFKVGLVYAAPGQKTEAEVLRNREGSQCFNDFLSVLGERVELKGFTKYTGGLKGIFSFIRITNFYFLCTHFVFVLNSFGIFILLAVSTPESVYTTYGEKGKEIEIMFHVSTMLPYKENDPQQLDRKRHIGNDVVVVIFKESNGPDDTIDLRSFRSHFNHVFIVVTPILPQAILHARSESQSADTPVPISAAPASTSASSLPSVPKLLTKYAVSVGSKGAVKPFPPYFPEKGNVFGIGKELKDWLLKKSIKSFIYLFILVIFIFILLLFIVINGERSAVESPEFRGTKMDVKVAMLNSVIDELSKK